MFSLVSLFLSYRKQGNLTVAAAPVAPIARNVVRIELPLAA